MRKIVLSLAAAGAALIAASPAAAQYAPVPQPAPYGYGHGNWRMVRELQVRVDNVQRQINRLDRRDRISERAADRFRYEANRIERRLRERARDGLSPREAGDIQYRLGRLEQQVQVALRGRYGRY
jgi:hypothetical protein